MCPSGLCDVEIPDGDQLPGGDGDVFSHTPVPSEPDSSRRRGTTFVFATRKTSGAPAASDDAVDRDGLATLESLYPGSERLNPPSVLVAKRERNRHPEGVRGVDDVQVGMACASSPDTYEHFTRRGIRLWNIPQFRRVKCGQLKGTHTNG
jgi:hypothetical protein